MPVADIDADAGKIVVATQFHERYLMKQIPGARYVNGQWTVPLSWPSCIMLRGIFGVSLTATPALAEWSWAIYNERISPAASLRDALSLDPDDAIARAIDAVEVT